MNDEAKRIAELEKENRRLRAGLQWYADGNHFELDEWEDCSGESPNWLFPPLDLTIGDPSWMIDDGGIARGVLDGYWINPNHDADNILIGPIKNDSHHAIALQRIEELIPIDPATDSPEGKELVLLSEYVELYEKERFPIDDTTRSNVELSGGL